MPTLGRTCFLENYKRQILFSIYLTYCNNGVLVVKNRGNYAAIKSKNYVFIYDIAYFKHKSAVDFINLILVILVHDPINYNSGKSLIQTK